jgi:hypothetical protein
MPLAALEQAATGWHATFETPQGTDDVETTAVVLASGGRCFAEAATRGELSTNHPNATGETTRIALDAGAEARDLDGSPGSLWLKDGPHHLVIYKGGYRSFDEDVSVRPGQKLDLKVRLEKGASPPPGTRPDVSPAQAH